MTKAITKVPEFCFSPATPNKTGKYEVLYRRSKSRDIVRGTATFRKRAASGHESGFSNIINTRTNRPVLPSFDKRDSKVYSPAVVAWA